MPLGINQLATQPARELAQASWDNAAKRADALWINDIPVWGRRYNQLEKNHSEMVRYATVVNAAPVLASLNATARRLDATKALLDPLVANLNAACNHLMQIGILTEGDFRKSAERFPAALSGFPIIGAAGAWAIVSIAIALVCVSIGGILNLFVKDRDNARKAANELVEIEREHELAAEALSTYMSNNPNAVPPVLEQSPIDLDEEGSGVDWPSFIAGAAPLALVGVIAMFLSRRSR